MLVLMHLCVFLHILVLVLPLSVQPALLSVSYANFDRLKLVSDRPRFAYHTEPLVALPLCGLLSSAIGGTYSGFCYLAALMAGFHSVPAA